MTYQTSLPNCCGVDDVGSFYSTSGGVVSVRRSGTGLFIATFIDTEGCKHAYKTLCKNHRLLYQSPVKLNRNSGEDLFLCVFEWKGEQPKQNFLFSR